MVTRPVLDAFGPAGIVKSTNPQISYKQQQAAAAQRQAEKEAAERGEAPVAAAAPAPPLMLGPVRAGASDVLYALDGERHAARSRVVQWWRCHNAPLPAEAKRAARLFAPVEVPKEPEAEGS